MTSKAKSKLLSRKQIRELFEQQEWTLDEDLSEQVSKFSSIYTSIDRRVLILFNDQKGRLYPSLTEFLYFLEQGKAIQTAGPQHILKGRFPYGQDFLEHVPRLVDALAVKFRLPRETLDLTVASLEVIDQKIRRYGKRKALEADVYPLLVAYVGEVMRHNTRGRWEMRQYKEDETIWEPWVIDPEGLECNPWLPVYDELYEQVPFSIAAAASARIRIRSVPIVPNVNGPRRVAFYDPSPPTDEQKS